MSDPRDIAYSGRFEGRTHLLPVRVYYEDTDFSGVVYHATYARFFERGRSDFLRAAGIAHAALLERADPLAFAVLRLDIRFKKPARIDDSLVVATVYESVSGARIMINQSLTRAGDTIATALVEACCIGLDGRPRRAPKELLSALSPYLAVTSA
jgi:acyl-CoA thioester hydrolase